MFRKKKQYNNPILFKYILHQICSSWGIWLLFLISILTSYIIVGEGLSDKPIGAVLGNISSGYIAGMIFYIFSDFAPRSKRKIKEYNRLLYLIDCRLKFEMESCLGADIWIQKDDKEQFPTAMLKSLCVNNISNISSFSNVVLSREKVNTLMFDLEKAEQSANIIIISFSQYLTPQWHMVFHSIANLKSNLIKFIYEDNGNLISIYQNLKVFAERFSNLKFELNKMINEIEEYRF